MVQKDMMINDLTTHKRGCVTTIPKTPLWHPMQYADTGTEHSVIILSIPGPDFVHAVIHAILLTKSDGASSPRACIFDPRGLLLCRIEPIWDI